MTKQNIPPPFCFRCQHFTDEDKESPPRCKITRMIDLVSGQEFHPLCQDMRHPEAPCKQAGELFEPKITAMNEPEPTGLN